MLEKLEGLADRYDELENQLASPNLYDDPERAAALTKEHRNLQPILKTYSAYQTACQDEQDAKELLEEAGGDADMHALAGDLGIQPRAKGAAGAGIEDSAFAERRA